MSLEKERNVIEEKLLKKWKRVHLQRLEHALYKYSLGTVTAGVVAEELRLLKMLDDVIVRFRMGTRDHAIET